MKYLMYLPFLFFATTACKEESSIDEKTEILRLQSIRVGTVELSIADTVNQVPIDENILLTFSNTLDRSSAEANIKLLDESGDAIPLQFAYLDNDKTIAASSETVLSRNARYSLQIGLVRSIDNEEYPGINIQFMTKQGAFNLASATIDDSDLKATTRLKNISITPSLKLEFTDGIRDDISLSDFISIKNISGTSLPLEFQLSNSNKTISVSPAQELKYLQKYSFEISPELQSESDLTFEGLSKEFFTQIDSTFKFPEISDEQLLTKVQEQTFKYFWDFAHPNSGLARERNTSGDLVTIGGSGFGVMAIIVGIERGFITRQEGVDRFEKIVDFLASADRFHGVWPHWMNGNTGLTIPFSANDDGADLVETAFMIQGLLAVRQYLNEGDTKELEIRNKITELWEAVEWTWFTQGGQNVLTWHWSPNYGFEKNLKIRGWNEALIIYTLAAASPTYPISKEVYTEGWARNGAIVNGNSSYGITMPLGSNLGGPLFFAHYSFLAMDPRNLADNYANYMQQNIAHSQINRAYCIDNPQNYVGYGENAWGLTASDTKGGYTAHSPSNDRGAITPTAAISSIPYTPEESMDAIRHFYYLMGNKLWGEYGFYDAYNVTESWYATSYLAIDQGPIIIMIENHRSALIWDLYMQDQDVQRGLYDLGFTF